jgi:hypothetical protein
MGHSRLYRAQEADAAAGSPPAWQYGAISPDCEDVDVVAGDGDEPAAF